MGHDYPDIPGYELLDVLGTGGFASVYLARQIKLDRLVALKVMDPALARDREFCERFVREARDMAVLDNHVGIVTVFDIGRIGDIYYIAMQYLPGPNLKELIEAEEPYQHPLHIVGRLAEALAHAHDRGFVHRDVKPANVLFDERNEAVLSDFGIAKALGRSTSFTTAGAIIGTAKYMSPEQAKGLDTIDHRSDLYSLGVVLYELLTRTAPYRSGDWTRLMSMHISEPVPILPESESIYQPLIDRLMAKRPEDRYESATELLEDMARYRTTPSQPSTDETHRRRDRRTVLAACGVLVAVAVGTGYMTLDPTLRESVTSWLAAGTADPSSSDGSAADAAPPEIGPSEDAPPTTAPEDRFLVQTPANGIKPEASWTRVERLLEVAELHEMVGRISEPPGANALEAYTLALELDPDNETAREALSRLRSD